MQSSSRQTSAKLSEREAERLAEEDAKRTNGGAAAKEVIEEIDELLADIDDLLEEQSVLVNYRQKGGQ